jgi:hypothetical protein
MSIRHEYANNMFYPYCTHAFCKSKKKRRQVLHNEIKLQRDMSPLAANRV